MKKLLISLAILFGLLVPAAALPGQASAVEIFDSTCQKGAAGSGSTACKSVANQKAKGENPIIRIIRGAIDILSFLIGIIAVIGLVVSGIRLMTAGGDSNSVASARSGLIYSLVGIAVIVLSQAIVAFALGR